VRVGRRQKKPWKQSQRAATEAGDRRRGQEEEAGGLKKTWENRGSRGFVLRGKATGGKKTQSGKGGGKKGGAAPKLGNGNVWGVLSGGWGAPTKKSREQQRGR